jgi:hypothetical protein
MRTPAERHGDGARPRLGRVARGLRAVACAGTVAVGIVTLGTGPAGAQEDPPPVVGCVVGGVPLPPELCPVFPTTTEAPATTTTARPTTTTTAPPVTTTEPPATTEPPSTAGPTTTALPTSTIRSTTTRPAGTPATVAETTASAPATDPATASTAATIPSGTTAVPVVVETATSTTAAPTTFDVVDKPPTERVTPIGLSQEVASPPVDASSNHTAQVAVMLGGAAAIGLVVLVGYRERHRPEAD